MVNPPPINGSIDSMGGSLSLMWAAWFNALYRFVIGMSDYTNPSIQTLATGFSITIGDRTTVLTLTPAGVLATGTITMPKTPYDGMPVEVSSTQTITGLTVSPNSGQTIKNAPTTLTAGLGFGYYYNLAATTWYRRY